MYGSGMRSRRVMCVRTCACIHVCVCVCVFPGEGRYTPGPPGTVPVPRRTPTFPAPSPLVLPTSLGLLGSTPPRLGNGTRGGGSRDVFPGDVDTPAVRKRVPRFTEVGLPTGVPLPRVRFPSCRVPTGREGRWVSPGDVESRRSTGHYSYVTGVPTSTGKRSGGSPPDSRR